jgi:hypothetical protein
MSDNASCNQIAGINWAIGTAPILDELPISRHGLKASVQGFSISIIFKFQDVGQMLKI